MPDALTILTSLVSSGALTGALIWFASSWISERLKGAIKNEYDEKLETHKAQLKAAVDIQLEEYKAKLTAENAVAVERLKAELQMAAFERQIRYQKLHEQVAETVAQTYSLLRKLRQIVATKVTDLELQTMFDVSIREFHDFYVPRRIYLPEQVAKQVDEFEKHLRTILVRNKYTQKAERNMPSDKWLEMVNQIDDMMFKETPRLFEQLESEFRKLLGSKAEE